MVFIEKSYTEGCSHGGVHIRNGRQRGTVEKKKKYIYIYLKNSPLEEKKTRRSHII
jgi:hypothetical protein